MAERESLGRALDLPDEVLAMVLARIPLGKGKVALQCVSKQWQRVLQLRSAHSIGTFGEDEGMPPAPNVAIGDRGPSRISEALLNALVCYTINDVSNFLVGLPPQLEALKVIYVPHTCQSLLHLKRLECTSFDRQIFPVFPNLEELTIGFWDIDGAVMADIQNLRSLRVLDVCTGHILEFLGPPGCNVHYLVSRDNLIRVGDIPGGLAARLKSFEICVCDIDKTLVDGDMDLAAFAECPLLEKIVVSTKDGNRWHRAFVSGLDQLPAACSTVVLLARIESRFNPVLPYVQPVAGWQTVVEVKPYDGCVHRVATLSRVSS